MEPICFVMPLTKWMGFYGMGDFIGTDEFERLRRGKEANFYVE
ncbi:hypothetical protein [Anaerotignum sp.]|nr:hypothetical protein [Anaerotignum sp.]MDY5416067.1 hypothetical protein [Anaerotignum sp.]